LVRPSIEFDGFGYYSILATALFDHDFDLTNEMAQTDNHNRRRWYTSPKDGRFVDPFPVGAAILWTPVVAISYALDPRRPHYHDPGAWPGRSPAFEPRYVKTIAIATALEAVAAIAILLVSWKPHASRAAIGVGTLAATIGTPLVYYTLADPSYAHTASFF